MNRLILLAMLALAACAAPQAPVPHPTSAACVGSFSAPCLAPYMAEAKREAAGIVNRPGSDGASIPTLSATYGPQPPAGFLGATPVIIVGRPADGSPSQ